jgi:vacuolar-type H+-ATPase subunit E/Vma4
MAMTIAPLLGQLRDSARAESERRLDIARAEAGRLVDAATAALERRRQAELERRAATWSRERERRLDESRVAAARETLAASEGLVTRVLQCAVERAAEIVRGPEAAHWLAVTIANAIDFLPDGPVVVRTALGGGAAAVRACAPGREVREMPEPDHSGVVLESAGGEVRVDVTLARFLRAERARLAQAIIARATGKSP